VAILLSGDGMYHIWNKVEGKDYILITNFDALIIIYS